MAPKFPIKLDIENDDERKELVVALAMLLDEYTEQISAGRYGPGESESDSKRRFDTAAEVLRRIDPASTFLPEHGGGTYASDIPKRRREPETVHGTRPPREERETISGTFLHAYPYLDELHRRALKWSVGYCWDALQSDLRLIGHSNETLRETGDIDRANAPLGQLSFVDMHFPRQFGQALLTGDILWNFIPVFCTLAWKMAQDEPLRITCLAEELAMLAILSTAIYKLESNRFDADDPEDTPMTDTDKAAFNRLENDVFESTGLHFALLENLLREPGAIVADVRTLGDISVDALFAPFDNVNEVHPIIAFGED